MKRYYTRELRERSRIRDKPEIMSIDSQSIQNVKSRNTLSYSTNHEKIFIDIRNYIRSVIRQRV